MARRFLAAPRDAARAGRLTVPFVALDIPPGIAPGVTPQDARGRWWRASQVRWRAGRMQPVGGWQSIVEAQLPAPARAMLAWRADNGTRWLAAGTATGLYAFDGGTLYDITPVGLPPLQDGGNLAGYGFGLYGAGTYGTARPASSFSGQGYGDGWSLDVWGEDLLAVSTSDGRLLRWRPSTPATVATAVPNAPTGNRAVVVTAERHILLLGAGGNPRRIEWCSQEDPEDWTPTATNTAGGLTVQTEGTLREGRRVREGALIWADDDVHLVRYLEPPLVYGIEHAASGCGLMALKSIATVNGMAFWMGNKTFFAWRGAIVPVAGELDARVFLDFNRAAAWRSFAFSHTQIPEIWFMYPDAGSSFPGRYAVWDYNSNIWFEGTLPTRTAAAEPMTFGLPMLGGLGGEIYEHERNWSADGASRAGQVFAETGDIDLADGNRLAHVLQILPDRDGSALDAMAFSFFTRSTPMGTEMTHGPFVANTPRTDGYVDCRVSGRSARLRIEPGADGPWTLGRIRLDVRPGGGR